MLGGITLDLPAPDIRPMPPPNPVPPLRRIPPGEPKVAIGRVPVPMPRAVPPDIEDMPPDSGDRLNDVRFDPIVMEGRDRKASSEPPPMRPGMNPSNMPP